MLLKEIHHRVKNNLQVISSLLKLQSQYINDGQRLALFRESQNRVRAMALLHEKLYQSSNLARIQVADYIHKLASNLFQSYAVNSTAITLKVEFDEIFLDVDTALRCGLIINELVSNALKYSGLQSDEVQAMGKIPDFSKKSGICVPHSPEKRCMLSFQDVKEKFVYNLNQIMKINYT